jgi:hypothetical protein
MAQPRVEQSPSTKLFHCKQLYEVEVHASAPPSLSTSTVLNMLYVCITFSPF